MPDLLQLYGYDGEETTIVECFPTCSEHFVVSQSLDVDGWWNVTHKQSTMRAIGPFRTQDECRLMAGIMAALPIPWEKLDANFFHSKQQKSFAAWWGKLPKEIKDWRSLVAKQCEYDVINEMVRRAEVGLRSSTTA